MKRALQIVGLLSLLCGFGLFTVPWFYRELADPLNPDPWVYMWAMGSFHILLGGGVLYLSFRRS